MDVKKGDILVFIGQETEVLKTGEKVVVISKDPKGATIEFDDGSKKKVPYNILKQDWELKESSDCLTASCILELSSTESDEDESLNEGETEKTVESPKKEVKTKKEKVSTGMKKVPNEEAMRNKELFLDACEQKGCEVIEQSPFFAVKYNNKPIFEVFKSKMNFNLNCNEDALTEDMKKLGRVLGHGRSNDFRIENKSFDEIKAIIDVVIEYSVKHAEELKKVRKERFNEVRAKKASKKEAVEA